MRKNNLNICIFYYLIALTAVLGLNISNLYSQNTLLNLKILDTIVVKKYIPTKKENEDYIIIKTDYAEFSIKNPKIVNKINVEDIVKIELLYTDFPKGTNVELLNQNRIKSLLKLLPGLECNNKIKWTIVKQTGATSNNKTRYIHGFVLTYSKFSSVESQKEYIKKILSGNEKIKDSTVYKIMSKHKNWNNMLIVCDYTASMTPHVAGLLLWYHLNFDTKKNQTFLFFNDGNNMPDEKKKIGSTGGFYYTNAQNIEEILNKAIETTENGDGGDSPENDVEAILFGIEKFPEKETILLIADNNSAMRDYSLIKKINKPVKIILCGVRDKVNAEYLDLAMKTNGSVYTIEQDILDLVKLKDGDTINIGNSVFKIINGRFIVQDSKNN